jgi:hypothetical protein
MVQAAVVTPPPVTPPPATSGGFLLRGLASEVSGTKNGSTVNPASGFAGKLTVRGGGSVNFPSGGGVSFKKGGQQNGNTAFYTFAGSQVGNVFNANQGEISFNLTSSYSYAARLALPQYNYRQVFDVFDNGRELFCFQVQAVWGRMMFYYNMGGTAGQLFYVPVGYEEAAFGEGKTINVRMVWDGKTMTLYANGYLAASTPYTKATPNWTNSSSFTLGANDPHVFGGGYFSCDDVISDFQVLTSAGATN